MKEEPPPSAAIAADAYMKAWTERKWISEPSAMPPPPHRRVARSCVAASEGSARICRRVHRRSGTDGERWRNPLSLDDMYLVHQAMQDHVLASELGGLCGYKLGAVGVIEGEVAISAPLFQKFCVDTSGGHVSAASIQAHNLEAEVGMILQVVRRICGCFVASKTRLIFAIKPRVLIKAFSPQQDLGPKPDGTQYSLSEVWAAVECVMPVIEICGRRSSAECLATQVESRTTSAAPARGVCWACAEQGLAASRKLYRCPQPSPLNPEPKGRREGRV